MTIKVLDKRVQEIVDTAREVEAINTSFNFTEGPIWHPVDHHLTFSDIPESKIYRWSESAGLSVYREPTNMANGNTYDKMGRILSCEHATSQVRRDDGGSMEVLASHYEGMELNSPNDIIVRSDGMIFFTDPAYGRRGIHGIEREQELDFQGVYQLDPVSLELTLLSKDFVTPNGLCFGLDESVLFVADTQQQHIRQFQMEGASLTGGEVFTQSPAPDGLKIDSEGHLYAGGPGGVHVYHRDDGQHLGVIETAGFCANFTWGGTNLDVMYMTSSKGLYQCPVNIPGSALF